MSRNSLSGFGLHSPDEKLGNSPDQGPQVRSLSISAYRDCHIAGLPACAERLHPLDVGPPHANDGRCCRTEVFRQEDWPLFSSGTTNVYRQDRFSFDQLFADVLILKHIDGDLFFAVCDTNKIRLQLFDIF